MQLDYEEASNRVPLLDEVRDSLKIDLTADSQTQENDGNCS